MQTKTIFTILAIIFFVGAFSYIMFQILPDMTEFHEEREMENGCLTSDKRAFLYNNGNGVVINNLSDEDKLKVSEIINCLNSSLNTGSGKQ